ncbi:MAG: iron ABC transporter permease [Desulfovibrio sp.]|jgi:iron complex transport system permease protein|nr:iron ABC transporter permease [Desulfovibrio sp.]
MKRTHTFVCLLLFCGAIVAASPFWGMSTISPSSIWTAGHPDAEVFWRLRFPRTLVAFLAGAGLSISGMVFQALLRNPLATPFTLGVSSGAALGASVYFRLGVFLPVLGSMGTLGAALCGSLLSMAIVYLLTRARGGLSTAVMLLAGVVINFFFSSLVMFTQYLSDANDSLRIMHWLMGSLTGLEIFRIPDLAFVVIVGALVIRHFSMEIDLLAAGEELAASRGVRTNRAKLYVFVIASIIVGTVVSLTGPIGFVGMMIPHICRLWLGWTHRTLLPAAFFLGGCFLVVCDLCARSIMAPAEMPIGIITALIGGPFFLWVLFKSCRAGGLLQ